MTGSAERRPTKKSMRRQNGRARLRRADLAKLPKRCKRGDSFWSAAARWRFAGYGAHGLQSRSDRGTTAISLLHYSTTAFTAPLHCVEDNEPLEHRHACL